MGLDHLHRMLRMMAGGGGSGGGAGSAVAVAGDVQFDMTPQQLRVFLQTLIDAGKLEFVEGAYAVCAPATTASASAVVAGSS